MHARWLSVPVLLLAIAVASSAFAQGKGEKETAAEPKKEPAAATKAQAKDTVRRDPKGVTGISPFTEQVIKGNSALVAKENDRAIEAYKEAIKIDPKQPLGPYLLGEAQLAAGKLDEADGAWQDALKLAGDKEDVLHAKIQFVLADLRERQARYDDAAKEWKGYAEYVAAHPKANGYPNSATERQKAIQVHKDVAEKSAKVKERIQQREKETAAAAAPAPAAPKGK